MVDLVPVDFDPFSSGRSTQEFSSTITVRPSPEQIRRALIERGLSPAGADAMTNRAAVESGNDTQAIGDGNTSFGLWQDHLTRGDALMDYAKNHNLPLFDLDTQADFAIEELKNKFPDLYKTLQTTTDPIAAYQRFTDEFERPARSASGLGPGSVRYSDFALSEPTRRRNTDLVSMSPQDYLSMSPPLTNPWQDRSGKSLLDSLKSGDAIEQVPSLTIKGGDVTDQDGRHRALAAQDAGLEQMPVAIQRQGTEPLPASLTGMQGTSMATPQPVPAGGVASWLVPSASAAPAAPMPSLQPPVAAPAVPATAPSAMAQQTQIAGRIASEPRLVPVEGNPFEEKETPVSFDPTKEMTRAEKFGTGMLNPEVGLVQQAVNLPLHDPINAAMGALFGPSFGNPPPGPIAQGINQFVAGREQEKAARGADTGWMGTLGEIASPVNLAANALLGPVLGSGLVGASQPQEHYNPLQTAENTGVAMLAGKVLNAVGNKIAGGVAPTLDAAKRMLVGEGVRLTPGQLAGGTMQKAENALARIPIAGALPRQAELQSFEDFNRAAINRALSPVGMQLPPNTPPGHSAVKMARDMLSNLYNRVLPRMVGQYDAQLHSDFTGILQLARNLPPELQGQLDRIMQHDVIDRFSQGGGVSGLTAQEMKSNINNAVGRMQQSENPDIRRLGGAVKEVGASVERMMERQNPQLSPIKKQIDRGWANYKIIEDAAQKQGAKEGVFTPAQLANAARNADETKDNRAYAHGKALLQDLAEAGKKVLPDTLSGSPTAEISAWHRLLTGGGLGAGLGYGAAFHPGIAAGVGAGLGAANIPYTPWGRAAVNALAQPAGPVRNALSQIPRQAGQYGAAPAGIAATQLLPQDRQ